ncbi:MAG TPA: autotransporter-associated beta strand repeat-containing protein [Opitutaceae bacterium]
MNLPRLFLAISLLVGGLSSARAQTITETFMNSTAPGWVFGGSGFTPTLTSGGIDPSGDGWLRLTDNANNRATYAYYDTALTSSGRTFFTSFDFAHYNGSGADGMTFFLFDGSVDFSVGAFGGSMGYAQKTTAGGGEVNKEGLAGGYLAISLDDFGNFSNGTEGRVGGIGSNPNSVAVRGPGSGYEGYEFIAATGDGTNAALTQQMDFPSLTTRPNQTGVDYRHAEILITPTNQLTVWLQFGAAGTLSKVLEVDLSGYLRPETLKFGFTSGTGGATEIHELRALTVATLVANLWDNGGGTSTWSNATNWDPNFMPATNADILFNNAKVNTAQTIDVGTGATRDVRSISIDAPFSYVLNNGTIRINDGGLPGYAGINVTQTNGVAAGGHTINSAINLDVAATVTNATTSLLTLGGAIDTDGFGLTFTGTGNTTANGIISDTGALTKSGTGTLTLNAANTYSGGTTLQAGNLVVGNNAGLGTGTVNLAGGTLSSTGGRTISNAITLTGNTGLSSITTTGTITQSGANRTLALSGATLNGGLALSNDNTGRTLTVAVATDSTIGGVISNGGTGASGLTKTGTGTLTISGANTYTGATTINDGTLKLGASDRISNSSNVVIGGSGTLDLNGFSERIGNLTASAGGATLDFGATSGANTFLFNTYTAPASGVLVVNNWEDGLDKLGTTINSQTVGSIYFSGYGVATYSGTDTLYGQSAYLLRPVMATEKEWDGSSSATWSTANNWTATNAPTSTQIALFDDLGLARLAPNLTANTTIAGVKFGENATASYNLVGDTTNRTLTLAGAVPYIQQQSASSQTVSIARLQLNANTVADITGSGNLTINSSIRQDVAGRALIKDGTGAGKLILGGTTDNTFSGGVFINNGIVQAAKTTALGTGTTTIANGATLELAGGISPTNAISVTGAGVGGNGAIRNVSGTNTMSGTITQTGNTTITADASSTLNLTGTLTGTNRDTTFGGGGAISAAAITTGTGAVTINSTGSGTVTFNGAGANTYTGTTTVNNGTLILNKTAGVNAVAGDLVIGDSIGAAASANVQLNASNQIANTSSVTIYSDGRLNLNNQSETIRNLNSASTAAQVALGSGTLSVTNAASNSYAGSISGTGTLNKSGVGRTTLSGSSTGFTGATNLNEGIIALQSGNALGSGTITVAAGANLEIQGGISVANNLVLNGNGTGAIDGAVENFSGNNTLTGGITLATDARIQSSAGTLTASGGITGTNRNLVVSGAGDTVLNGAIATGTGNLTKEGGGTLTLGGANTYTGDTLINAGTLALGASNRIADASDVVVAAGAVFDLNGFSDSVQTLAGAGTVDFGGGALTLGTGLTTATNTTFSGTFVGAGSLKLADADYTLTLGAAMNNSLLDIELAGSTLALGGFNHTFDALTVSANSILDFGGASTVNFSSVSFTGNYTLTVQNWNNTVDYFYSLLPPTVTDLSRIVFNGFSGNQTKYEPFADDNQITPVPEPSTYGAIFMSLSGALGWWVRRRKQRARA